MSDMLNLCFRESYFLSLSVVGNGVRYYPHPYPLLRQEQAGSPSALFSLQQNSFWPFLPFCMSSYKSGKKCPRPKHGSLVAINLSVSMVDDRFR